MRSVFVSYDGALDPLGASQVVPYLRGLARAGVELTLVSFEKPQRWSEAERRDALARELRGLGIRWQPLSYHKAPRVPATAWDVLRGAVRLRRILREQGADVVHCRGDVAMLMARAAGLPPGASLLYDVRGFFRDERVESGSWREGGVLDGLVRRVERGNLRRADGLVVLTDAALPALEARRPALPPSEVIPTSVDTTVFHPAPASEPREFGLVYAGSLGSWYLGEQMVAFAREASKRVAGRTLFLSPQPEEARRAGATPDWAEVRALAPEDVPGWLRRARAAFFFCAPTPARRATCPTKLGEALASGLPVACNTGIGDLDRLLEPSGVGVVVRGFSPAEYRGAAGALARLVDDTGTAMRCRALAEGRFDLKLAVAAYHRLYLVLSSGAAYPSPDRARL